MSACSRCGSPRPRMSCPVCGPQVFDTERTDEIVCPHCGYGFRDSWDVFVGVANDSTETECPKCDGRMSVSLHTEVTYTTTKL